MRADGLDLPLTLSLRSICAKNDILIDVTFKIRVTMIFPSFLLFTVR
jgi:hypothetical protein